MGIEYEENDLIQNYFKIKKSIHGIVYESLTGSIYILSFIPV